MSAKPKGTRKGPRSIAQLDAAGIGKSIKKQAPSVAKRKLSTDPKGIGFVLDPKALDSEGERGTLTVFIDKTKQQLADELIVDMPKATGMPLWVSDRVVAQLASVLLYPKPQDQDDCVIKSITTIGAYGPSNVIEASLASQMIAANEAIMQFMQRALVHDDPDRIDKNVNRATRLMRVFLEQVEAFQKLKGKTGQQKVTVEHVHVYEGGQAIVGMVTPESQRPGGGDDSGKR